MHVRFLADVRHISSMNPATRVFIPATALNLPKVVVNADFSSFLSIEQAFPHFF
jgi:hypothetical protein